ncbi:MAG TPA: AMP-binding protein [bacterium]|nr:AMP-binding protein [bacterium]
MGLDFSAYRCLAEALRDSCERHRSRTALIEVDRDEEKARLTYGDVLREGERLASLLIERGLKPGDRCVLLLPNQSKWVVTAAAVMWAGGIVVPIDVKLGPWDQAGLIDYAEPALIVTDADLWRQVEPLRKGAGRSCPVIFANGGPSESSWDASAAVRADLPRLRDRGDIAAIIFTSGTGGDPKGCMISDGAYMAQMVSIDKIFPLTTKDRYLSIIPANHVVDFMCGFLLSLMSGAAVVHQRTLRSQYIVDTMKKYRITCTALVPLLLRSLRDGILEGLKNLPPVKRKIIGALMSLNRLLTRRRPLFGLSRLLLKPIHDRFGGCLSRFVVGGSFVDPEHADFFYGIGFGIHIGYGLTEICTVIALNDLRPYRGDTVGPIVQGGEVEIRNVCENGVGEVWIRAPFLMSGYFKNEKLTSETIVDGWLHSGDLGRLEGGHLKLTGRSKNVIVTEGGKNIYPEDVETAFRNIEECDEYCVFADHYVWPQEKGRGDRLILILRPKEWAFSAGDFSEKIRQANHRLDYHKRISGYLVWERPFPRTASLKVKREGLALVIRNEGPRPEHVVPV